MHICLCLAIVQLRNEYSDPNSQRSISLITESFTRYYHCPNPSNLLVYKTSVLSANWKATGSCWQPSNKFRNQIWIITKKENIPKEIVILDTKKLHSGNEDKHSLYSGTLSIRLPASRQWMWPVAIPQMYRPRKHLWVLWWQDQWRVLRLSVTVL